MINTHWLELPLSQTNFHGPNAVRAIEVRLYLLEKTTAEKLTGKKIVAYL